MGERRRVTSFACLIVPLSSSSHLNSMFIINASGLVTLDEMKAKQEDVIKKRQLQLAKKDAQARLIEKEKERKKKKEQQKVHDI